MNLIEVFYLQNGRRKWCFIDFNTDETLELIHNNRTTKNGRHYFLTPDSENHFSTKLHGVQLLPPKGKEAEYERLLEVSMR